MQDHQAKMVPLRFFNFIGTLLFVSKQRGCHLKLPKEIESYKGVTALVIDQGSTNAGWCLLGKKEFASGAIKCRGIASYDRIIDLFNQINEIIELYPHIELIVFEGSTVFTHQSMNARIILCHLHFRMEELAYFRDLPVLPLPSPTVRATWKKLVSAKYTDQRYSKDLMRDSVEHYFQITERKTQDELDAIAIAYTLAVCYKKLLGKYCPSVLVSASKVNK